MIRFVLSLCLAVAFSGPAFSQCPNGQCPLRPAIAAPTIASPQWVPNENGIEWGYWSGGICHARVFAIGTGFSPVFQVDSLGNSTGIPLATQPAQFGPCPCGPGCNCTQRQLPIGFVCPRLTGQLYCPVTGLPPVRR